MKLRHIFTMLMTAVALTFVGCQEPERFLDEVKVSQSYIAIPAAGGDVKITVDAVAEWSVVAIDKKTFKEIAMPEWLTISPLSGPKGKTEVTFSAGETKETREVFLNLNCKDVCQELNVMQMTQKPEAALSTCNEVLTNGVVDQFYRIKGVVAEIPLADFQKYGKFFITDDTTDKSVEIYGCANKSIYLDKSNNPTIEVGDIVTIEGSWSKYGNFNNDTQILEVEKSLIKIEKLSPSSALDADGDVFTATLTNKGDGLEISIPEADQTWLSAGEPFVSGTTTVVEFTALANAAAPRTTTITFSTTSGGQTYSVSAAIEQNGGIPQVTVKEAVALPADSWIRVTGIVTGIHKKGLVVTDEAGDAIYAYVNKTEAELGAALGDKVNVTGKIGSYANFYQIVSPEIEVVSSGNKPVYPATVTLDTAESFKAYEKGTYSSIYIEATGVTTGQYGDITIGDWVVSPYQTSETIKIADFKDKKVVVKGYLLQYKSPNTLRVMLTSVVDASTLPDPSSVKTLTNAEICAAMTEDNFSYVDYTIQSASGVWTVNASKSKENTFLQCRGQKGSYIKTPLFEKDIKSVTIHFTTAKKVYSDNTYCVFPATWTATTAAAAYPEDGNVGKAVTAADSYSLKIPVNAGNKQVCVSIIGTYSYYLDHIDVEF